YSFQFIAVLVAARYFGFGPAVTGLALSSAQPVYRAISTGRDTTRYWIAFLLSWAFCIGLIWLLDRHRRMRSAVETSTRLADERMTHLAVERTHRDRQEHYSAQLPALVGYS